MIIVETRQFGEGGDNLTLPIQSADATLNLGGQFLMRDDDVGIVGVNPLLNVLDGDVQLLNQTDGKGV